MVVFPSYALIEQCSVCFWKENNTFDTINFLKAAWERMEAVQWREERQNNPTAGHECMTEWINMTHR